MKKITNKYESAKIRQEVLDKIKNHSEKSGLSISDVIALGLPTLDKKCEICGKSFLEHAFIFGHNFKIKK